MSVDRFVQCVFEQIYEWNKRMKSDSYIVTIVVTTVIIIWFVLSHASSSTGLGRRSFLHTYCTVSLIEWMNERLFQA